MKARKGDLVLIERTERTYGIGVPTTESTTWSFGMVASAARDGVVKSYFSLAYGEGGESPVSEYQSVLTRNERAAYVMPKASIDVAAVLWAAKAHHWPGHPTQPMPFDSVEEAREIARPHRKGVAA